MRIAILHYWFLLRGGGERVVEILSRMYPDADLYCLLCEPESVPNSLKHHKVQTSFLNSIPMAKKIPRLLFPFYPAAVAALDLQKYDLVISSDSPPTKNITIHPGAVHVSYCHAPPRYMWDQREEFSRTLPAVVRPLFSALVNRACRLDAEAAQRVHGFAANSKYTQQRIYDYYRRESEIVYPPVETGHAYVSKTHGDYYLTVGRMVNSKRMDLLIQACNVLQRRLVVAGSGRDERQLQAIAGPTIEFVGSFPAISGDPVHSDIDYDYSDSSRTPKHLPQLYAGCRAFLSAADEDFGIVYVEAQAYGRPVIALGHGGAIEVVRAYGEYDQPTGLHFAEQTVDSVVKAILKFESVEEKFNPQIIHENAKRFDTPTFERRMANFVNETCQKVVQTAGVGSPSPTGYQDLSATTRA